MQWLKAFVAGFLATLIFHQGVLSLFFLAGLVDAPAYDLSPVPPWGVPKVLSLAFFGGLWGVVLWALIGRLSGLTHWALAVLLGALGPTMVAMLVVFPLKGLAVSMQSWVGGFIVNAAWGLGTALLMLAPIATRRSGERPLFRDSK